MTDTLAVFNALPAEEAEAWLRECCPCPRWASRLAARRPFADREALLAAAAEAWQSLPREAWVEALGGLAAEGTPARAPSSGTPRVSRELRATLIEAELEYRERFGFPFVLAGDGTRTEPILAALAMRMANDRETEIAVAAAELAKSTRRRLERLFA